MCAPTSEVVALYAGSIMTEPRKRSDVNELARSIVQQATGQAPKRRQKDAAAVERGRKGGEARAASLTPEERREIAVAARAARGD